MKKWLLGIICMLMVLGLIFSAGCGKQPASPASDRLEVRNSGTAIQWKYSDETDWHDLVALDELRGAAGENGKDGVNGKDGIDGVDGKDGADGKNGKDGVNGKDGANGKDGVNGKDGADGNTPFIGENGNWWIGTTDTGVKAAGLDGEKGDKGDKGDIGEKGDKGDKGDIGEKGDKGDIGEKGEKGDIGEKGDKGDKGDPGEKGDKGDKGDPGEKGDKGDAGQNGSCPGYYHAKASTGVATLQNHPAKIEFTTKINKGGLISASGNEITLKKGHIYNIIISGSLGVSSNASGNTGYYCIQMTDSSEDADFCRKITRIKRDGTSARLPYTHDYHSFNFNRMYDASAKDITLKFLFEQSEYNTLLEEFSGTITITALD